MMEEGRGKDIMSMQGQTAALALSLLVFSARMWSAASVGKLCEGQKAEAVSRGEVILDCPVAVDVHQTKQSAVIKYFEPPSVRVEVLGCDWMRNIQNFDCLKYYGAELIAIKTDRVLARLPEDSLHHNGSYHCEVVPSHYGETFPDCDICYPADPTTTTTTPTPTTTAASLSDTGDAREAECGGLVTNVVLLSVVVILQLMLILAGVWIFYSRLRMLRGDNRRKITTGGHRMPKIMALPRTRLDCQGGSEDTERSLKKLAEPLMPFNDTGLIFDYQDDISKSAPGQKSEV